MAKAASRQCPRCGNTLLPHQKFCARCGELVSDNTQQAGTRPGMSMAGAPVEVAQEDFPEVQEIPSTPETPPISVVSHDPIDEEEDAIEDRPTAMFERPSGETPEEVEAIEDRPTTTFERPSGGVGEQEGAIEDRPTALFRKPNEEDGQGVVRGESLAASAGPQDTVIARPRDGQAGVVNPVSQAGGEGMSTGANREWDGLSARARARNRNNPISRSGGSWGTMGAQEEQDVVSNGAVSEGMGEGQEVGIADEPVVNRGGPISQGGRVNNPISSVPVESGPISQGGRVNNPISSVPVMGGPVSQGSYASSAVSGERLGPNTNVVVGDSRGGTRPSKRRRNLIVVVAAIVVVLVLLGVASYLLLPGLTHHVAPITQPPIKQSNIDTTANYAGVDVTIVNVQQTEHFIHSTDSNANGVVRLAVRAHNGSDQAVNFDYHTLAHLLLPGGKEENPLLVNASPTIAANGTQAGTIDFAVPTSTKVGQLVFRLGDASKVQIDIPLNGQANLSRYQPQSSTMNQQVNYLGLSWTVSQITTQNSLNDQQADKGMRYVTVTINVSNTVSQTVIAGSPYDYLTLQAGGKALTPVYSTLPTSFDANASNVSGTVTFQVAQSVGKGTLTWSASSASGFDQATTDLSFPS